ncbi:MAG TPA: hypothetical protein DCG75_08345 [Bacteroidales bacterium]|nr:hypothetical protein [Bacteroidales bacterium]
MNSSVYKAEYEDSLNPFYKGNPLIECLNPLLEFKDFFSLLTSTKPISRTEALKYTINQRDEFLTLLKHNFFVPSEKHYSLYRTIYNSLTSGYHLRKPIKKEVNLKLKSSYRNLHTASAIVSESTASLSSCLLGISGIGKTTIINKILSLYPGGISHNLPELDPFVQIPFIKIECPKDSSLKDLCLNFFGKLDALLSTSYQTIYGKKRETVDNMVLAMAKLTISHQIGMIIVDEIQHLTNVRSNSADIMLNFFVNLNNTLQVPIFIVGTPESINLFGKSHRLPRRWSGEGAEKWNKIPFNDEWKFIMEMLFKYQYTEEAIAYDEDWASLFYYHSQGIIDRAIRIFIEAQKRVLFSDLKKLSREIVEKTIKEKLWLEKDAMEAIRSKRKRDLSNYPDLYFPEEEIEINESKDYRALTIKKILEDFSIPINFYTSKLGYLLQNNPDYDNQRIALDIMLEYKKSNTDDTSKAKKKAPKLITNYTEGDLRKCYDNDLDNLHEKLLENDSLLNVSEYFLEEIS